jgi:hypothetical protein
VSAYIRIEGLKLIYANNQDIRVDASYGGLILVKIIFLINSYKIFLNDSNGHGCYFFKCHYYNF